MLVDGCRHSDHKRSADIPDSGGEGGITDSYAVSYCNHSLVVPLLSLDLPLPLLEANIRADCVTKDQEALWIGLTIAR